MILQAQEVITDWLRQQPELWAEAKKISDGNEYEIAAGYELADQLHLWLFDRVADDYLVNDLGMSPTLRNQTAAILGEDGFWAVDFEVLRTALLEE